ncbi:hypothetical protein GE061_001712 [Apolygus lucorum]|uniref:Kazal-like domain-containing protein n=1 Tax=Apolygus lucorum TaxID=248454 RepID=A0A6A4K7T6_APOLU|nr:hypothetical protein GE061_001712 [Apolygus lucorum]
MVDKATCCSITHMSTAWSPQDLDPGALFFWRVLGGGIPCTQCRETCADLKCGPGKRCLMKNRRPTCVCWPMCKTKDKRKGRVCGSDGRTYASICRLKKKACRTKNHSLELAYFGSCGKSCDKVTCPFGKHCLMDQMKEAHCVECNLSCPYSPMRPDQMICGVDGVTYSSVCHLRAATCATGKAIPMAYKGPCSSTATCSTLECSPSQLCLTHQSTGAPRCVTCDTKCPSARRGRKNQYGGLVCGSNNRTYVSWCHMMKDACATGLVIETKYAGSCKSEGKYYSITHASNNEVHSGRA